MLLFHSLLIKIKNKKVKVRFIYTATKLPPMPFQRPY